MAPTAMFMVYTVAALVYNIIIYYYFVAVIRVHDITSVTVVLVLFAVNFILLSLHFEPSKWYIILIYAGLYNVMLIEYDRFILSFLASQGRLQYPSRLTC